MISILLTLSLLAFSTPTVAQDQPVVVELFTSQGCSSCPPADAIISRLATRDDVIPLALHVDYWDYLGWPDRFASAAFSGRQRAYAKAANKRTVYTPQVVVQGVSHAIGNRAHQVQNLIAFHANRPDMVEIDLHRSNGMLVVGLRAINGPVGRSVVQLVRFVPEKTVQIRAGENAGRQIVYSNIVTYWKPILSWNGRSSVATRAKITGPEPVVVLVQSEGFGPIIAAKVLR